MTPVLFLLLALGAGCLCGLQIAAAAHMPTGPASIVGIVVTGAAVPIFLILSLLTWIFGG